MKHTLLIAAATCALLTASQNIQAATPDTKERTAQISAMCHDKETRILMIRELMSTRQGKAEMAEMLKHDAEFRSFYEVNSVNAG